MAKRDISNNEPKKEALQRYQYSTITVITSQYSQYRQYCNTIK